MHEVILFTYRSALPEVIANVFFGGGASFQFIHLDGLRCIGTEPNLLNCTHNGIGVHNCEHSEDVGIICARSQGNDLKIRKQHDSLTIDVLQHYYLPQTAEMVL